MAPDNRVPAPGNRVLEGDRPVGTVLYSARNPRGVIEALAVLATRAAGDTDPACGALVVAPDLAVESTTDITSTA
jgi:hypothetical protein